MSEGTKEEEMKNTHFTHDFLGRWDVMADKQFKGRYLASYSGQTCF